MRTRIISALVGTVVLLLVLFCPWTWVFALAAAVLAAIAVWELLHNTGAVTGKLPVIGGMMFALIQVLVVYRYMDIIRLGDSLDETGFAAQKLLGSIILLLPAAFLLFVAVWWLCMRRKVKPAAVGFAVLATAYTTVGFSSVVLLRILNGEVGGLWNILLLLVIPFMSDTGAYFVGTFFGKHKMAPVISPKKSWEGFFGGWAISIGCAALLAVIYGVITEQDGYSVVVWVYAALAAILAPISVCGDLLASMIKRHYGIKDYGNLMPGHGGVMDRFDSVLIVAPLLYVLVANFDHIAAWLF